MKAHPWNDSNLSIADLLDSGVWLKRFHGLLAGGAMRIEHSPGESDDPTHAIIYRLRCDIGAWCFFAIVRRDVAVDTVVEGKRTLYMKAAELLEAHIIEGSWTSDVERILLAYARHARSMGDPTYFWDLGDLEDWIAKISDMDSDDREAADAPRG